MKITTMNNSKYQICEKLISRNIFKDKLEVFRGNNYDLF